MLYLHCYMIVYSLRCAVRKNCLIILGKTNEGRHDYTKPDEPKPGHHLLPGFGLCELTSVAADNVQSVVNVHTYVCELTQHILYQYILIVMWYIFILGIVISIVGFLKYFFDLFMASSTSEVEGEDLKVLFRNLTSREKEYMKFVRRKSMPIFGELLQKLKEYNSGGSSVVRLIQKFVTNFRENYLISLGECI